MSTIPIFVEEKGKSQPGTLGVLTPSALVKQVDAGKLRQSLTNISEQIATILQDIKQVGEFKLKEVQVSVEISAEGEIAIVGAVRGGAGAKGAMTLTFSI